MKTKLALLILSLATLVCTSSTRAQSYDVNGGDCDVTEYSYATDASCPNMGTNFPDAGSEVTVNFVANPDGTLTANSSITFVHDGTETVETLTGTAIKGVDSTGAPTIAVQGKFSGQYTASIAFTITRHVRVVYNHRYYYWSAGPGAITQ